MSPAEVFGADPVGVGVSVSVSCLHDISFLSARYLMNRICRDITLGHNILGHLHGYNIEELIRFW